MDFLDIDIRESIAQFSVVERVVRSSSFENLALLFNRKLIKEKIEISARVKYLVLLETEHYYYIFPCVFGVNMFLVQFKTFVVRYCARIAEVINAGKFPLGHDQTDRKHLSQHGHRVGYVHYLIILDDLGKKVSWGEIITDGHANSERAGSRVYPEQVFRHGLSMAVPRSMKVRGVLLGKT